ncbi:uncharacterized protein LOC128894660 [Hylaeus anthracinus]|uniref:uncharacterized protein LOC128872049 n=1 Tax=Hylaeus volcanicus TaxID=313075 RepID=UPI0023B82B16|nr:uncharacterized protein LOC128872049 [Hylaeus volcanicus]XP_054012530.1 uncharacterized protein LOC128894660 [Hylaeus anthracinus]
MKMKRSRSLSPKPSSSEDDMKRIKLEEDREINDIITHQHILDFSDDVLLNILKYLNPQDLMAVSLCCQRLNQIVQDKTLWRKVDFRALPMSSDDLKEYVKFFQPMTTTLAIRGCLNSEIEARLSPCLFNSIKHVCTQLKELVIEQYNINGNEIQITDFPRTIEKLSLQGCKMGYLPRSKSYFYTMNLHMPDLTCLILSNCSWFTSHSLLVISKMPKLKELRLNSCHSLGECIAYTSLATKLGFQNLEILDLRDTALGDSEVGCFSYTKTLTHLYLECPTSRNSESTEYEPRLMSRQLNPPTYEDENLAQFWIDIGFRWETSSFGRCNITDRTICTLGSKVCDRRIINNTAEGAVFIEEKRVVNNPRLKTLVVRNYPNVTDTSLEHLAITASSLEYLDVTGTSVTRQGVESFKSQKSNVKIVSSFSET